MQVQAHEQKAFLSWMRETGNMFTGEEYQTRLGIWLSNKRLVKEHNAANLGFKVALNKLAHLTPAEYKNLLGYRMNKAERKAALAGSRKISASKPANVDSIDYREKGACNPIKDQGQCGSCWAFSAVQAQESVYFLKTGELQSLSEQNLVDCVTFCDGCNGGLMHTAYTYVMNHQAGKWMTETDYPYTAVDGTCKFDASKGTSLITGWYAPQDYSEKMLAEKVVEMGPAAVAIDASHWSFQLYESGIYDEPSCNQDNLDHGVGCVGFGSENGVNYWIIRNSWGTSWGEQGYIRMVKDKNNQCGVASEATIPESK